MTSVRILFINPPMQNAVRFRGPNRSIMQFDDAPPLGIMAISAYIKRHGYKNVEFINGQARKGVTDSQILAAVERFDPDVVGFTVGTIVYYNCVRIAALIKESAPGVKVVLGGPHLTVYGAESVSQPPVDFGVVGEGEYPFLDLLRAIESGGDFGKITGLVWKRNGEVVMNPPKILTEPIDALPLPDYSLFDPAGFRVQFDDVSPTGIIISSRGCPYRCTFCCRNNPYWRGRSAESVVDEMIELKRMGYRSITFYDDTFNVSKKRVLSICRLIRERGVGLPWSFRGRVNGFDEDLARTLAEAGCVRAHLGIEAGTQEMLDKIKKGVTLEEIRTAFALCRKHGILTVAYFILGLPGETLKQAETTIELAFDLDPDFASFHSLMPIPGSEIYRDAVAAGAFDDYMLEWAKNPTPELSIKSWETGMSEKQVFGLVRRALFRFYFRPAYILKTLRRIGSLENFLTKARTALSLLYGLR
jgi:anaerobic magnesium-protoporphyrin IX monomethyl ester cyclase